MVVQQSLLQFRRDLDPTRVRFHLLSTFPLQELDQVALASHCGRRLTCTTPCRHIMPVAPGAHLAHGTEQRTQSGGQERWTDPTVETSMRPVAGPLCAPSCACLVGARAWRGVFVAPMSSAGATAAIGAPRGGGHRLAARRRSSACRAEAVISLPRGERGFGFRTLGPALCFVGRP